LKESTKKLNRYTAKLEEFNAALKVLLKERENERADMEEKILINIKYHFSPPLEKLKKRIQNPNDKALLEIVQSGMMNITSSFSQKLSSKDLHLTPSEIKIANMIKDGKTTKEIAESMGVSTNAINHHRYHIRKKLGIDSQKINLRAYLSSIKK
jgi:DNA-binding CsgD family transcriptional regulator